MFKFKGTRFLIKTLSLQNVLLMCVIYTQYKFTTQKVNQRETIQTKKVNIVSYKTVFIYVFYTSSLKTQYLLYCYKTKVNTFYLKFEYKVCGDNKQGVEFYFIKSCNKLILTIRRLYSLQCK